jgi:hypothetical protein
MITASMLDPEIFIINKDSIAIFVGSVKRPYINYNFKIYFDEDRILIYSIIGAHIYSL